MKKNPLKDMNTENYGYLEASRKLLSIHKMGTERLRRKTRKKEAVV